MPVPGCRSREGRGVPGSAGWVGHGKRERTGCQAYSPLCRVAQVVVDGGAGSERVLQSIRPSTYPRRWSAARFWERGVGVGRIGQLGMDLSPSLPLIVFLCLAFVSLPPPPPLAFTPGRCKVVPWGYLGMPGSVTTGKKNQNEAHRCASGQAGRRRPNKKMGMPHTRTRTRPRGGLEPAISIRVQQPQVPGLLGGLHAQLPGRRCGSSLGSGGSYYTDGGWAAFGVGLHNGKVGPGWGIYVSAFQSTCVRRPLS